ncbi:MAG: hypothetical protein IPM38_19520 [Ignavibacteria bacterium]|nr:hypothetical protein [Ignavibacteria bacterium]
MIDNIPDYVSIIFIITVFAALILFYRTVKNSESESVRKKANSIFIVMSLWLIIQSILTVNNVYSPDTHSLPPKIFLFGILPAVLIIILLFVTNKGKQFTDNLPLINLTYLNVVRIPVEVVLYWLFLYKAIPELMTFEGSNFDIIAGITSPLIAYFGISKGKLSRKTVLIWNFICLGLLINIILISIFSAPAPFQKFAFDQPNIGVLFFPYSWLPVFIVPVIFFGHLASIRQLLKNKQ